MAAEAAISSVVELLGNLLIEKVKFLRGVRGQVELLRDELTRMRYFLMDANKKQAEDDRVRNWIAEIRELAQDAEDAIEMFFVNVKAAESKGKLRRFSSLPKRTRYIDAVGKQIQSIQAKLESINRSRETYGIEKLGEVPEPARRLQVEARRRVSAWQNDEHLVGVEDDVEKLLQLSILNEKKRGLSVAVINGMGGIGKSTLARKVYNHIEVVGDRFDCRGWVVVSSEFTPPETIKQLIIQLPRSKQEKQKLRELEESTKDELYLHEKLAEMLHKQLEGKSYLIVLDDVWESEHLESLITAFPNQQDKRGRVLVTSRNKIITKYDQYVHNMTLLSPEKGWELLLKKANVGSTNGKFPDELKGIGRQIVDRCGGLPLAISVVGGLLMESHSRSKWIEVLNQINSYLGRAESSVSSILELSYQNLSPQLKSCFLCMAFFKEDYTIPATRLVNIWVAQGLIQQEGSTKVDEIARGYMNELINRSMVQIEDQIIDDRVKSCRLHDLLREICLRKAEEEIGLEIVKGEERVSLESRYKPRHRVVYGKSLETSSLDQNRHIRSLFLLNNVKGDGTLSLSSPSNYWKSFQLLKMLDLDSFELQRFPDSFRILTGLKSLRIHKSEISFFDKLELPSWLDSLKNLEVLCMENQYVMFPDVALKMENLRYFQAYSVTGRAMKIENWKNIESLKGIRVDDWVECSSILTAGCRLRELGIHMNGREGDIELREARALLGKMTGLVELHLESVVWFSMDEIIPLLDSLSVLEVSGGMLRSGPPTSMPFLPNLSHLTLEASNLNGDPMQELGKLPNLQYLTLVEISYEGGTMRVFGEGFPCLEALALRKMHNLILIDIDEGGMPVLKQLQIHGCPRLKTENLPKHVVVSSA